MKFSRGTTATTIKDGMATCNLDKLAECYQNFGNVPKFIGEKKAMEIALLSRAYLRYRDADKRKYPRKNKPTQ